MLALVAVVVVGVSPQRAPAALTDPPVYLRITTVGPAGWRARLGPTNLGAMLASADGESSWRPLVDRIDEKLRHVRGDAAAFGREREQLLEYGGHVHVVAWLEQPEDALHAARWSAAVVVEPDGKVDLAALAGQLQGWLVRAQERQVSSPWRELEIVPPRLHEGRLVAVLASPEDREAASARAAALRPEPLPRGGGVLRLELDLQQALLLLHDRPSHRGVVAALAGAGTRMLTIAVGAAGPQVVVDASFGFGSGDRGLVGSLCTQRAGTPSLDFLAPPGPVLSCTARVDFLGLRRATAALLAASMDCDVARVRPTMPAYDGLVVADEGLAHLGDEAMFLWFDPERGDGRPGRRDVTSTTVRLLDEQAFRTALQKELRRDRGWSVVADSDERIVAVGRGGSSIGVGHGFACFASGGEAAAHVGEVLDRAEAARLPSRGALAPSASPPHAPAGWNGRGTIEIAVLASRYLVPLTGLLQLQFGAGLPLPIAVELQREVERRLPLLRLHELTSATAFTGATASGWQLRILW